jgi:hypothetical protein
MSRDLQTKREELKALFRKLVDEAHEAGRPAVANVYYGRIIRVDAGRYDDRIDEHIATMRGATLPPKLTIRA